MPELDPFADLSFCSGCQKPLSPGTRFCRHCGRSVSGESNPFVAIPIASDFEARWKNIRAIAWLFGLLLATSFILGIAEHLNHSPWLEVIASSIDALIILGFAWVYRADVGPLFAAPRCDSYTAVILGLTAIGFIVLMTAYFRELAHLGVPMLSATADYRDAGWSVGVMFLLASVMPGFFEEIGFRGVIQSLLERTVDSREAWLIQAALFSVMHLSPIVFPSHFVMGLVFGYLRLRTRSLYPGMALHMTWNALQVFSEL